MIVIWEKYDFLRWHLTTSREYRKKVLMRNPAERELLMNVQGKNGVPNFLVWVLCNFFFGLILHLTFASLTF